VNGYTYTVLVILLVAGWVGFIEWRYRKRMKQWRLVGWWARRYPLHDDDWREG
jgi:hypothetical protein